MSRIRVELLGASGHRPRIQLVTGTTRIEVLGNVLEHNLGQEDAELIVDFKIPGELLGRMKTPQAMPVFRQSLTFRAASGALPASHLPTDSNSGARLHPRFIPVQSTGTALGTGSLHHYQVDCRFLPMTDMARALGTGTLQQLDSKQPDPLCPSGMQVRLYECTVGSPRFWVVAYAPGNTPPQTNNLHALVFLMPKSLAHTNLTDLNLNSARRYLLSAPKSMPFFIRCDDAAHPLTNADWISTVTNAALLEQVLASGKPVFVALPVPSGSAVVPSGGNIRELMTALRRGLHADEFAKQAPELPGQFRVAVSGFSKGAHTAADLLSRQQSSVDEFYWFDPGTDGLALQGDISNWLQGSAARRLRLIGTTVNATVHAMANGLNSAGSRVSAMPEPGFRRSQIYKAAVAMPVHSTATTFPETFQDASDPSPPPKDSLSDATGIFIKKDNGDPVNPELELESRDLQNKKFSGKIPFTPEELAGKARFGMLNNDRNLRKAGQSLPRGATLFGQRLHSEDALTLTNFVARFRPEVMDHGPKVGDGSVHQWAAVGGLGGGAAPSPRSGFKGFFQICIEAADFPK